MKELRKKLLTMKTGPWVPCDNSDEKKGTKAFTKSVYIPGKGEFHLNVFEIWDWEKRKVSGVAYLVSCPTSKIHEQINGFGDLKCTKVMGVAMKLCEELFAKYLKKRKL